MKPRTVTRTIATKHLKDDRKRKYLLGDGENFCERIHWLCGFADTLIDITRA